jgi:pimeloyl-ACP methyl ester carboxylesterase
MRLDEQAWLDLAQQTAHPAEDIYQGRLHEVGCPTLIMQGGLDPRTESGELAAVMAALPRAELSRHPEAGHSPHSESSSAAVTEAVLAFLESLA